MSGIGGVLIIVSDLLDVRGAISSVILIFWGLERASPDLVAELPVKQASKLDICRRKA